MQKIITFCSGKGGVGKSTVACCVAAAIVCRGRRVLLVDADQGLTGLDLLLGMQTPPIFDICDLNGRVCDCNSVIFPCEQLAGLNLASVSLSSDKACSADALRRFCRIFSGQFDYIIIDASAGLGSGFEAAVRAAQEVAVLCTPEATSIRAAAKTAAAVDALGIKSRLIINKYDSKLARTNGVPNVDRIIDTVGSRLLGVVPADREFAKLSESGVLKLPRRAVSVEAFYNIAARICGCDVPLAKF